MIRFGGTDLRRVSASGRARLGIAHVPESRGSSSGSRLPSTCVSATGGSASTPLWRTGTSRRSSRSATVAAGCCPEASSRCSPWAGACAPSQAPSPRRAEPRPRSVIVESLLPSSASTRRRAAAAWFSSSSTSSSRDDRRSRLRPLSRRDGAPRRGRAVTQQPRPARSRVIFGEHTELFTGERP